MKLNQDTVWTIQNTEFKVLKTVEYLTKTHDIVPYEQIQKLNKDNMNLKNIVLDLCKSKFLRYENIPYLGYSLTTSGYDCLGIHTLRKNGLSILGDKIGIGKESDIYYGVFNGKNVAVKFHRLGRTSFRTVKNNRDYHGKRKHCSWFLLSKLSAEQEYKYMHMFYSIIDIPKPLDQNRHIIVMELLEDYVPLYKIKQINNLDKVYCQMMQSIETLLGNGYVHGDFNEFNIMINENEDIKIIDLPQCISVEHAKAKEYLQRDIEAVKTHFYKKYQYVNDYEPNTELNKDKMVKNELQT
ncbi:Serine/threonine-protein kinase rio2 [Binucleata daphniae]